MGVLEKRFETIGLFIIELRIGCDTPLLEKSQLLPSSPSRVSSKNTVYMGTLPAGLG